MHKYSVEVSHYIVTYYKDTKKNPDTGETEVERKQSHTPLTDLNWIKGFDNFIEENRWVDSEIVDILDKVWKALPGKHVYLSKSISQATLDIKLSNYGYPKTIYRIVYKHHRNELGDYLKDYADKIGAYDNEKPKNIEDKKLEVHPCPFPVSDEERALLDRLKDIRQEFKTEIEFLKKDGLISLKESRRIVAYFSGITSSISYFLHANDNGRSLDRIKKAHDELQTALKDVEIINIRLSQVYSSHADTIIKIVDDMHNLIWDVDALGQLKDRHNLAPIAIPTVDYCSDYIFHTIDQHLSSN